MHCITLSKAVSSVTTQNTAAFRLQQQATGHVVCGRAFIVEESVCCENKETSFFDQICRSTVLLLCSNDNLAPLNYVTLAQSKEMYPSPSKELEFPERLDPTDFHFPLPYSGAFFSIVHMLALMGFHFNIKRKR